MRKGQVRWLPARDIVRHNLYIAQVRGEGYGQGVAIGDCDNDGRQDVFVTSLGSNHLYRNRGDAVFEDVTSKAGVAGSGWSTSAGFIDYDRDGTWIFSSRAIWTGTSEKQAVRRGSCPAVLLPPERMNRSPICFTVG